MTIRVEIEGKDTEEVHAQMREMIGGVPGGDVHTLTFQTLIALVEKRASEEGYEIEVLKKGEKPKSAAETRKDEARSKLKEQLQGSLEGEADDAGKMQARKDGPDEQPPAKTKKAKANGKESEDERKARCVTKLQELFSAGKKKEVMKILADHGEGAKTFNTVPADKFGPISDALEAL